MSGEVVNIVQRLPDWQVELPEIPGVGHSRSMTEDFSQNLKSRTADDDIGNPHRPPRLHGSRLAQIYHQKHHRVVDQQDWNKAEYKAGNKLPSGLQHCKWTTQQYEKPATRRTNFS